MESSRPRTPRSLAKQGQGRRGSSVSYSTPDCRLLTLDSRPRGTSKLSIFNSKNQILWPTFLEVKMKTLGCVFRTFDELFFVVSRTEQNSPALQSSRSFHSGLLHLHLHIHKKLSKKKIQRSCTLQTCFFLCQGSSAH